MLCPFEIGVMFRQQFAAAESRGVNMRFPERGRHRLDKVRVALNVGIGDICRSGAGVY